MIRQICNVKLQDIVTIRSNELLAQLGIADLDLILKEKRLHQYGLVECSNGAVVWRTGWWLMESIGLGGPRWQGSSWQRGIVDNGSSQLSSLMIDPPGDLVWDLPCVQQASYLEEGHWCGCCSCTCTLIKNPVMMMLMNKAFPISWQYGPPKIKFLTKET